MTAVQTFERSRIIKWFNATPMQWFDRIVVAAIIMTPLIFVWELCDRDMEETLAAIDTGILGFFVIELAVRVKHAGRKWYRDPWIWFDAVIIGLALLPLGEDMLALRLMRACRLAHMGRHLPHLRHIPALRWLFVVGRRTIASRVA